MKLSKVVKGDVIMDREEQVFIILEELKAGRIPQAADSDMNPHDFYYLINLIKNEGLVVGDNLAFATGDGVNKKYEFHLENAALTEKGKKYLNIEY